MGADILQKYAGGNVIDSSNPKKENNTRASQKTSEVKAKNTKVDIKRTAQKVYGTTLKHIKVTGPLAPLGIAVDGVENYHDAETLGLTGWDKTKYVAKGTMYDFVLMSIGSVVTAVIVPGLGLSLTSLSGLALIGLRTILIGVALDIPLGDSKQSTADRATSWIDSQFNKVKAWFD